MAPVGALGQIIGDELRLMAVVLSADGVKRLAANGFVTSTDARGAEQLGCRVADDLLAQGAAELIRSSRGQSAD